MAVEFCTELADTVFQVTALFEDTKRFCGDYLSQKAPQYVITVTERDIDFERQRANQKQKEGIPPVVYSDSYLETLALYRKMAEQLVQEDVILMHGAVVAVDGRAYLFTAKSGTGKTTHIRRWLEAFGSRAVVVNGDKPLLRITSEGVTAYGTPWDGKEHLSTNTSCPLKALCILTRSEGKGISRELGTRHRAAIGITETTDAISLIVSEETGTISVAREGHLTRHLDRAGLEQVLTSIYQQKETGLLSSLLEKTKRRKGDAA